MLLEKLHSVSVDTMNHIDSIVKSRNVQLELIESSEFDQNILEQSVDAGFENLSSGVQLLSWTLNANACFVRPLHRDLLNRKNSEFMRFSLAHYPQLSTDFKRFQEEKLTQLVHWCITLLYGKTEEDRLCSKNAIALLLNEITVNITILKKLNHE